MSLPASVRPLAGSIRPSAFPRVALPVRLARPSKPSPFSQTSVRHATHGTQGRANGTKNGPGKRLGCKKTGDEYVIPGNIIFRQRGTQWHAGDNVGIGRDHTIYSLVSGYVKYYRDPNRHPDKKYIGVVFEKEQTLPVPSNAATRRRLGRVSVPRADVVQAEPEPNPATAVPVDKKAARRVVKREALLKQVGTQRKPTPRQLQALRALAGDGRVPLNELAMRSDYSFRETNYEIGRAAERAGVTAPKYRRGDRWLAWRKRLMSQQRAAEIRSASRRPGKKQAKAKSKA